MKSLEQMRGVGQVYRFTLTQHLKNRTNLISLIVMLVLALVSVPVASLLMGGTGASTDALPEGSGDGESVGNAEWTISEVYLLDRSGYDLISLLAVSEGMELHPLTAAPAENEVAALADTALYIHVYFDAEDGNFHIQTCTGEQNLLTNAEIHNYALYVSDALTYAKEQSLTAEELAFAEQMSSFTVESGDASELLAAGEKDVGTAASFAVQYVYAIILLMLCMMSSSYIIRAVVEEKSSKLIDLLMVSVRPLALLCGKILAMMTVVFGTLLTVSAAFVVSSAVTGLFLDTSVIGGGLESMGISLSLLHLGGGTVLAVLISLVLSYLTYSIMSGIAGATCSSMADMDAAMLSVTFVVLGGYLVSCVVAAIPSRAVAVASSLIPLVSAFCAPVQFVLGRIGIPVLLLSWTIQAAQVVVLARFGAKVYRDLILHQGKRVRLGEVLKMAKAGRGGAHREA